MAVPPEEFAISAHEGDGRAYMTLRGELDLATAPELEGLVTERLDAGQEVVVDLRGLEFMDSTGLRTIVVAALEAERAGGSLALVAGPEPVMRVFDVTRMRERLTFVDPPEAPA